MSLLHPAGKKEEQGEHILSPSSSMCYHPLLSCRHSLPQCLGRLTGPLPLHLPPPTLSQVPFLTLCSPPFYPYSPLILPNSVFLLLGPLASLSPILSLPPPTPQPRSLLGALAGLLLTEEPLDLRHPCCLALSRDKESGSEGPSPPGGSCSLEGGGGNAGREEAFTMA